MGAMGVMYKLKAYFGMVPAEELGEYDEDRFARSAARDHGWGDRWDDRTVRGDDRSADRDRPDRAERADRDHADRDRHGADRFDGRAEGDRYADRVEADDHDPDRREPAVERRAGRSVPVGRPLPPPVRTVAAAVATQGALAVDTSRPAAAAPLPSRSSATLPEQRERPTGAAALARITTLHPASYNEARTIGERYRDGVPVIMNLTDLDDAAAKRLVDFAAGLAFALRGSIDKVTSRVFLLTPADVEVSADDARKLVGRVGSEL